MSAVRAQVATPQVIPLRNHFPKSEAEVRIYRLWNPQTRTEYAHRYFSEPKRAHMAALIECRWSKVGAVIEVFNSSTGRLLGQYKRNVHDIHFLGA